MLDNVRFGRISASAVSKALFLLLFLMLGTSAYAVTIVVDDDGFGSAADCNDATPASSTIAAGVALAGPGDTVRVCSGTYPLGATVPLNQAGLTLIGVGPTKPVVGYRHRRGSRSASRHRTSR